MKNKQHYIHINTHNYCTYVCTVHAYSKCGLMHVTQTHTETEMHSPEHVELSRSKEYPAMHPHLKEPSVLEQVWEQLFLLD